MEINAIIERELAAARKERDSHKSENPEWKARDAWVQTLKAVQKALKEPNEKTPQVVADSTKTARAERARLKNTDRYKQVDELVQGLKGAKAVHKIQKPAEASKAASASSEPAKPAATKPTPSKKEGKPTLVVVLPAYCGIDHGIALRRQQLDKGKFFDFQVAFCHRNFPTPDEYRKWQAACSPGREPVLIDVGDTKRKGFESVAEMAKLSSSIEGGEAFNRLVGLANKLNSSPDLWRGPHAIPRLLQDIYFLREGDDGEQKVFDRMMDVVRAYFRPQSTRAWTSLFNSDSHKNDMLRLWKGFAVTDDQVQPFTIPQYFRHLFCAGEDRKMIQEKIGWWIRKTKSADARFRKVMETRFTISPFKVFEHPAGFVEVADYWEGKAFQYQWLGSGILHLAIIRNKRGHVVISSSPRHRSADLSRLYKRLDADEPSRWYLHAPRNGRHVLINGGFRFDQVVPTAKSSGDLKRLTWKYAGAGRGK